MKHDLEEKRHSGSVDETPQEQYEDASIDSHEENGAPQLGKEVINGHEKLKTKNSKASVNNVASIPNGGLRAWLQVAGAFVMFFNSWGVLNTYGAYQTYYETGNLFVASSSDLSWIGALQACLLLLVGSLTGPLYDAGHFKMLIWTGCFLVVFGQMMLSLCHTYWQTILAQAVAIGIGAGFMFVPSVAIISTYFNTRLALAVGIAASGSSLGGVIYPIVFHRLQPTIGFGWATRVIGFIMIATMALPLTVMRVRVLPPARRKLWDPTAFTDVPYLLFTVGSSLAFMGLYTPFFYIQYYAQQTGITNPNLAFYLLAVLNSSSVFGRIIPNFVADKTGPLNVMVPCAISTAVLIFALNGVHSEAGIIIIALLYGFFSGAFVSTPPAVFVSLSPSRERIGSRMGMAFSCISIFVLTGTPIAGAILGSPNGTHLNWVSMWCFGGATCAAGSLIILMARLVKTGPRFVVKA